MKLLKLEKKNQEIPAVLDINGKYRNTSSVIKYLDPENINFEMLKTLKSIDLESLEEIDQNERIGSCITKFKSNTE